MRLLHVMYCVFNFAQKHKSKYHCLPFYLVTLFLIDTLTLVKHAGTCVFWNYTLLMSCTLDLSSVITCKKATTSGIFSIGVGYCGVHALLLIWMGKRMRRYNRYTHVTGFLFYVNWAVHRGLEVTLSDI